MNGNELILLKKQLPVVKTEAIYKYAVVEYKRSDQSHYSFTCDIEKDVKVKIDESDQSFDFTDCYNAEYQNTVSDNEKLYYSVATASGIITGILSCIHLSEEKLQKIDEFTDKEWKPIIIGAANIAGYKKKDYKGAVRFLIDSAVERAINKEKKEEIQTVLEDHPSLAGFLFAIITQYEEKKIVINASGDIKKVPIASTYVIGKTHVEKIVCAFFYWLFELAFDEKISSRRFIETMRLSADLLKQIKKFINLEFIKAIPSDYAEAEALYSKWLTKIINNPELRNESESKIINPFLEVMKMALNTAEDSFLVMINEGIVCSSYMLIRICEEVKARDISSLDAFNELPLAAFFPKEDRRLSRMFLIASGLFVAGNLVGAIGKAIRNKKVNGKAFRDTFIAEINIVGIGRFIMAFAEDSKYWRSDISIMLQRAEHTNDKTASETEFVFDDEDAYQALYLDAVQAKILYNLENMAVLYDIEHTKDSELVRQKSKWLEAWKVSILNGASIPSEEKRDYFINDKDYPYLFNVIYQLGQDDANQRWIYLLTQELALFRPYSIIDNENNDEYKKLRKEKNFDFMRDCFVRKQTVVTQDEVDKIIKCYSKYYGYVSGKAQNQLISVGITTIAAVATGGAAFAFAPGIAAAIAGEAVVGLHGAALTSASLAFVGGGSLAAGGLGMAGGTAIITGGGALLGLVGSGSVSAASVLLQTPSEYWVRQSAKLLTYTKCVVLDILHNEHMCHRITQQIEDYESRTRQKLNIIKNENNDLDKALIKKTEEYLRCLGKCTIELKKMDSK